ncbi:MAG TPA: ABC transporter ATP-binding protein [Polyangiaceae bacterium]|nr:ABC transporter ATP-binding protein [Polyangiaceae bacterium]
MSNRDPLLSIEGAHVAYEGIISALRGVSLEVHQGQIVALLGSNGAGKSSTLKAISGLLPAERGALTAGSIRFRGEPIAAQGPRGLARSGLVQVLEGRRCFAHLNVEENLISGSLSRRTGRRELTRDLDRIYRRFPRLRERVRTPAGYLSGGEQQMLAIGRALMLRPRLLLLDEPSIGLAPLVVQEIFEIITELNRQDGVSVLIAEQNARIALRTAQRAYVLENGHIALSGNAAELAARDDVQRLYLGRDVSEPGGLREFKQRARGQQSLARSDRIGSARSPALTDRAAHGGEASGAP